MNNDYGSSLADDSQMSQSFAGGVDKKVNDIELSKLEV